MRTTPAITLLLFAAASIVHAGHSDILLRSGGGQTLVGAARDLTGDEGGPFFDLETRTFEALFVRPATPTPPFGYRFERDEPGFFSDPSAGGGSPLPPNSTVSIRKEAFALASGVDDTFYWNGSGEVSFSPLSTAQPGVVFTFSAAAFASTDASGAMDDHPLYGLQGNAAEGVYVVRLRARVGELEESSPFYQVWLASSVLTGDDDAETLEGLLGAFEDGGAAPVFAGVDFSYYSRAVEFVAAIPEPSSAMLSLLGLAVAAIGGGVRTARRSVAAATLVFVAPAGVALAQHQDILAYAEGAAVEVGQYDFSSGMAVPLRVFAGQFDSFYSVNNPGFTAVPSYGALPGQADLSWDFLPMQVGALRSTLLYWNGSGAAAFGAAPSPDYALSLFGTRGPATATADVSSVVPGGVVQRTTSSGALHQHLFFFLDDNGDGLNTTLPADGLYLISMRFRIPGLSPSAPFYMVWSTPGVDPQSAMAAQQWVGARVGVLDRLFPPGDYNRDGAVNAADYTVWRDALGTAGPSEADFDADLAVTQADYQGWAAGYGGEQGAGLAAPEGVGPAGAAALGAGSAAARRRGVGKRS